MGNDKNDFTLNRADSALLARDFSLAARLYRTVLANDPTNKDLYLKLGSTYVKAGQDEKAESAYLGVLRLDSSNYEALNSLGGVFRRLGKYQDSIKVLERALKIHDSSEVKYNMGFTYKLMEEYDAAAECFTSVIETNPNDVLAYNHLGAIQAKRGDHKKALQTYWKGLQVDQNHPVLHYNSALSFIAQGKYKEARESFENALRAKPGWPDAMNGLADLYMHEQDYTGAQELISQGLKINPENINLEVTQGRLHVRRGNYVEAESIFRSVLEKRPNDYSVMGRLERVYEKQNMFEEAYGLLDRMKAVNANEKDLLHRKIQLLINQGKLKDAGELLNQEKASSPNDPEMLNLLSQYFIRAGKIDKAHGCFKRLCEVKPGSVNFLWDAAMQFKRMGDYANAEDYMQKYLEKRGDNPEALCCLGDIYEEEKQYEKSLEVFKKVLEKDVENPRLEEAVSRVGAHVDTNRKDTTDMSELLSENTEQASPEELQEKIRLYENSVSKLEKFAVSDDQKPDDDSIGQDIDSFEKIDFDELLKLEYKDGEDSDSDYSNLIMEESPVDFVSEKYDDRKETLGTSKLIPQDMPFEFSASSRDDSGFNPLDYNYTPKYSPSEQNEMLDVVGSPFEEDKFEEEEAPENRREPVRYPQYPMQPQYPPQPPRQKPAMFTPQMAQPQYPEQPAVKPPVQPVPMPEESPALMENAFEDDPDVPPSEQSDILPDTLTSDQSEIPSSEALLDTPLEEVDISEPPLAGEGLDSGDILDAVQEPNPYDSVGEPIEDILDEKAASEEDSSDSEGIFNGEDDTSEGENALDDISGLSSFGDGESDEEKPFAEEDVEPVESELIPEEASDEDVTEESVEKVLEEENPEGSEDMMRDSAEIDSDSDNTAFEEKPVEHDTHDSVIHNHAPEVVENIAGKKPDEKVEKQEAPLRDEQTTMNLVSDALQNIMKAPVKRQFRNAGDMFKTLRTLSSSLQPSQKDALFSNLNELKLDYVVERLSSKPGLLSAASAVYKTGGIAGMNGRSKPSLLKTMTYMRTLINNLPDSSQSWVIGK